MGWFGEDKDKRTYIQYIKNSDTGGLAGLRELAGVSWAIV